MYPSDGNIGVIKRLFYISGDMHQAEFYFSMMAELTDETNISRVCRRDILRALSFLTFKRLMPICLLHGLPEGL